MIWILALHIATTLVWGASLLFLFGVLASACPARPSSDLSLPKWHPEKSYDSLPRILFTRLVTPCALLAIVSGTAVLLAAAIIDVWMVLKLTLVALLVAGHALGGALILRFENGRGVYFASWLLAAVCTALMILIIWLVLAEPDVAGAPWSE